MPVHPFEGRRPVLGRRVWLAPSAHVAGDVELGDDVSFWFHTVARGDVHWIRIGARTNVQDGAVLHVTHERFPLSIGADVVIGHQAMIHGCTIEDGALIGIGARVLDGAVIETGAQIGAGALVAPGHRMPAGYLALGVPARPIRPLRAEEIADIRAIAARYAALKERYRAELGDG
ncbi:MAG TPA: gamma carbonic anhydrase family protein [Thermoanaerobaculia bacterium]|nr:gamma carbonic anhydrase family protein [Thermoanaerobaculia bacterium]